MVMLFYGPHALARNPALTDLMGPERHRSRRRAKRLEDSSVPADVLPAERDHVAALMRAVDGSAAVTVDALVRAIPDHRSPLSIIIALVDAGLLAIDLRQAFDASTRVWRAAAGP